jgi:hypothetical protein
LDVGQEDRSTIRAGGNLREPVVGAEPLARVRPPLSVSGSEALDDSLTSSYASTERLAVVRLVLGQRAPTAIEVGWRWPESTELTGTR